MLEKNVNDPEYLNEELHWFSLVFEQNPNKVVITDLEGSIVYANKKYIESIGKSKNKIINKNLRSLNTDNLTENQIAGIWPKLRKGEVWQGEVSRPRHDGSLCWDHVSISPIKNEHGNNTHILCIYTDISKSKETEQTLKESEELYRLLTNSLPVSISYVDNNLRYKYLTSVFEKWFGIHTESAIGKSMRDFLSEREFEYIKPYLQMALSGEQVNYQFRINYKHKGTRIYEVTYVPHIMDNGYVIGIYMLSVDMTEHVNSKQALWASEERYRTLVESSPNCIYSFDLGGKFTSINAGGLKILNKKNNDAIIGKPLIELISEQDRDCVNKQLDRALHGHPSEFEYTTIEGKVHQSSIAPIYGTDRKIAGIVGIAMDITERRQMLNLQKSRSRILEVVTKGLPLKVILTQIAQDMEHILPGCFCSILILDEEKKNLYFGAGPNLPDFYNHAIDGIEIGPGRGSCGTAAYTGTRKIVSDIESDPLCVGMSDLAKKAGFKACWSEPFTTANGQVLGVFAIYFKSRKSPVQAELDMIATQAQLTAIVVERKRAEEDRAQLLQQLNHAQKMEAIGQFTGGVAHDFNNILASILGYASLADKQNATSRNAEKISRYLHEIKHAGRRGKELVEQMLIFSRSGYSEPELLKLDGLIKNTIQLIKPLLPSSIIIKTDLGYKVSPVRIDPVQFEQMLMNLVINARDAVSGKGTIWIQLSEHDRLTRVCDACHQEFSGPYVELAVGDSGQGISPEVLPRIFDPFYTTKPQGEGTGMGLAVVHGIMHEGLGHIIITNNSSADQKNTRTWFKLLFPRCASQIESITADVIATEENDNLVNEYNNARILIIDDEPSVANYLGELLADENFQVEVNSSSHGALRDFQEQPDLYDMVITDQIMPEMTGIELVNEIKAIRPDIPVILTTGYNEKRDEKNITDICTAYMMKPFDVDLLLKTIYEHLKDEV